MKTARVLSIAGLATTALLASALITPAAAAAHGDRVTGSTGSTAPVAQCTTIDFDSADVTRDASATVTLTVSGMAPSTNVTVELSPVIYIQQPEYWIIMVEGCTSGVGQPVLTPYTVSRDISSTIGTVGIEVQGANQKVRIPLKAA